MFDANPDRLERSRVAQSVYDDVASVSRQPTRSGEAETAGRAGDECALAGEKSVHVQVSLRNFRLQAEGCIVRGNTKGTKRSKGTKSGRSEGAIDEGSNHLGGSVPDPGTRDGIAHGTTERAVASGLDGANALYPPDPDFVVGKANVRVLDV